MVGEAAEVAGAAVGAPGLDSAVGVVLDGQDVGGEYLHSGVQGISHIAAVNHLPFAVEADSALSLCCKRLGKVFETVDMAGRLSRMPYGRDSPTGACF